MTVLITFICITLASAIAAGAFVYGKQVGYIQRDSDSKKDQLGVLQEQLEQVALEYRQLEMQYSQEKHDNQRNNVKPGGWNPEDLGNRHG